MIRTLRHGADLRSGNALLPGLMIVSTIALILAGLLSSAVENSESVVKRVERFDTKRAASSVNRLVAQSIWSGYSATLGPNQRPTVVGMRTHLDSLQLTDMTGLVPVRTDMLNAAGLAVDQHGNQVLGDSTIESILVHREDDARATTMFVTTVAATDAGPEPVTETLTDVFVLEPPAWDGLEFALLANNINCIMCHTTIDDARRRYPEGALASWGGSNRARVGSIENFQLRDDPESMIFGSLYLGGNAVDQHGDVITDWAGLTLNSVAFDADGRVATDLFGSTTATSLSPFDESGGDPFANLYLNYLDDPSNQVDGAMPEEFPLPFTDDGGYDPSSRILTDAGAGDRVIDDNEYFATTETFGGSITGGAIGVSPPGNLIATSGAAATLAAGTQASLGANTAANVVLTGTDLDPIRIDGQVAIDGDLIISGPIVGTGSLWVRGNIYVRGDLEYQDAIIGSERQFGVGSDGIENALGLTAGGNVVIGDPYRPAWGSGGAADGTESGSWNFTLGQAAAFNGREWLKTQETLPGAPVTTYDISMVQQEVKERVVTTSSEPVYATRATGNFYDAPVFGNVQVGTETVTTYETIVHPGTPGYNNGWTEKVATGTEERPVYEWQQTGTESRPETEQYIDRYEDVETVTWVSYDPKQYQDVEVSTPVTTVPQVVNPDFAGAGYVPRYYRMGPGDPVPIQTGEGYFDEDKGHWMMAERVDDWDSDELTLADPSDPGDPFFYPVDGTPAVVTDIEPAASWIDDEILRGLITDSLSTRDSSKPLNIDATVYSANSIFGVVPNAAAEGTNGKMRVQGALLAADVGLLGPEGVDIVYDPRGSNTLDVRDQTKLSLHFVGTLPSPLP